MQSMTGFAAATGAAEGWAWSWDIRSVNGRGLDLKLRVPDWIEGLEAALRGTLKAGLGRGSVTLSLRIGRESAGGQGVDAVALDVALDQVLAVTRRAETRGLLLAPVTALDLLSLRSAAEPDGDDMAALRDALAAQVETELLPALLAARRAEGAAVAALLGAQVDRIAALVAAAREVLPARLAAQVDEMRRAIDRLGAEHGADPARLAQELALLAVKSDVAEEVDRLDAHIAQARTLIATDGPVGRKLDFLVQEFLREANTLCSKSQHAELTRIGLDLKTVIDQMREQVQNVE